MGLAKEACAGMFCEARRSQSYDRSAGEGTSSVGESHAYNTSGVKLFYAQLGHLRHVAASNAGYLVIRIE
jgi:hypothetical protein